jgi:LysR family transcriptional regulator, glycine cleavage system transcriptional activator
MTYSLPPNLPPVECLVAAITAARTGSFSQAAIELGVSHAAISRRIAGAESWAGTALFIRHGRGVRPTDDGQRLLSRVSHAFEIVDQAANQWRKPQRAKMLRIATTHSLARLWLIPHVAQIEAEIPDIRIEIVTGHRIANLASDEAVIAIRYGKGGWNEGRETRLFPAEVMHPVASPKYIAEHSVTSDPASILAEQLIHNADSTGWQSWAKAHKTAFRGKYSDRILSDYTLGLAAAEADLGIALVNASLSPLERLGTNLQLLGAPTVISPLCYFVIVPTHQETPAVQTCVKLLIMLATKQVPTSAPPNIY